jgi:hypothetical protein
VYWTASQSVREIKLGRSLLECLLLQDMAADREALHFASDSKCTAQICSRERSCIVVVGALRSETCIEPWIFFQTPVDLEVAPNIKL